MINPRPLTPPCGPFGTRRFMKQYDVELLVIGCFFGSYRNKARPITRCKRIHRRSSVLGPFRDFLLSLPYSRTRQFFNLFSYSALHCLATTITTSADSLFGLLTLLALGIARIALPNRASPGKNAVFRFIYPAHLQSRPFGGKSFVRLSGLARIYLASYELHVLRTETLPPASFRFYLTIDTLALS